MSISEWKIIQHVLRKTVIQVCSWRMPVYIKRRSEILRSIKPGRHNVACMPTQLFWPSTSEHFKNKNKTKTVLILMWYITGPNFRYRCDGGQCTCANQMVLWVMIHCLKSLSVGAFTWSSLMWLQSVVVRAKKEFLCCSVFEWGTKNGLELSVSCLSIVFSAVKSWNFVGLICLLFAVRGFKNCSTGMASTSPSTTL